MGNGRAYNQERGGYSDVSQEDERRAEHFGRYPAGHYNQNGKVRSYHRRTIECAPIEAYLAFSSRNEEGAEHEYQQGAGEVEDAGIKHRVCPEDRSYDRVADKAYIAESQHETIDTPVGSLYGQEPWKQESSADKNDIGSESHDEQGQDKAFVGKRVAHYGRQNQAGARYVNHQSG